jgi:hypothetical protein
MGNRPDETRYVSARKPRESIFSLLAIYDRRHIQRRTFNSPRTTPKPSPHPQTGPDVVLSHSSTTTVLSSSHARKEEADMYISQGPASEVCTVSVLSQLTLIAYPLET